jgi:hypothetical protein
VEEGRKIPPSSGGGRKERWKETLTSGPLVSATQSDCARELGRQAAPGLGPRGSGRGRRKRAAH